MKNIKQANTLNWEKIDIGCGPKKTPGHIGVDIYPYEGVDVVQNFDEFPWNIPDQCCSHIRCIQVIEHMRDLRIFFKELHRISKKGCLIRIETPHYSSASSWGDPTHLHHLSVDFAKPFTSGYLEKQLPGFEVIEKKISFGSFFWTWPGRLIYLILGARNYERRFCWIFPASCVKLTLKRI